MKRIAVSQRVDVVPSYGERRDALDQRWAPLLLRAYLLPLLVPNDPETAAALMTTFEPDGVLLTGGNDLSAYGGTVLERDRTEDILLDWAEARARPVLGVCRGMQVLQHRFGVPLRPVTGHVTKRQSILLDGALVEVNSYHRMGAMTTSSALEVFGRADDGVIKAVRHRTLPLIGIMWHPEREDPFVERDLALLRTFFSGGYDRDAPPLGRSEKEIR
jgi:putative glutamine amidotransferase